MLPAVRAARRRSSAVGLLWGVALAAACDRGGSVPAFPEPVADLVAVNEALGDPHQGRFSLEAALAGLPPGTALHATLVTSEGSIPCTLDPRHAPLSVANFVGLSRGLRPFKHEDGSWRAGPYYTQMPWHRAEPGQFVQTGRRGRLAHGGFVLQDEVSIGDSFDRAGVLAMANSGVEHSGSVEFFVTTGPAAHLEGGHTILGSCDGEATLRRIERRVLSADDPPPLLVRIDISRP